MNKVMLIGHLGRDPELKYLPGGMPMATLSVATDESYTDRDGNRVARTEWHRVTVFDRQAENCSRYLHKGSLVYIEGKLQTRKWQDANGNDRYTTDIRAQRIQFLDRKGEGAPRQITVQPQRSERSEPESPMDMGVPMETPIDMGQEAPSEDGDIVPF